MKIIPKKDLLWLIQTTAINYYSLGDVEALFEEFGDDYFVSEYNHSVLELTKEKRSKEEEMPKVKSDFEKSMVEMTKRANDFVHEKRAEGITVIPAREFFEAIGIIDFFFGNDVGIDISNFKGDEDE